MNLLRSLAAVTVLAGIVVVVAPAADAAVVTTPTESTVTFTTATGRHLGAVGGGGGAVTAATTAVVADDTFTLVDINGGSIMDGDLVALRTTDGHYVSAAYGGGAGIDASRSGRSSWETFRVVRTHPSAQRIATGTHVVLRTTAQDRWVRVVGAAVDATADVQDEATSLLMTVSAIVPGSGPKGPFTYPAPGQRTGSGVLPASAASAEYLGPVAFDRPTARDLGFSGVVNGRSVWTFGDTLVSDGSGGYQFAASDSAALGDPGNPTVVHDKASSNGMPPEWIPLTDQEQADGGLGQYAEGGTNVVEYAPGAGLVYFLKNDRGAGGAGIVGAGVATVVADANGATATRTMDTMWAADEPRWGDIGATYDPRDGRVYVWGHGPGDLGDDVYLARVSATKATKMASYQYWNQATSSWSSKRLTLTGRDGTTAVSRAQAIFPDRQLGQSNAFWSNYYNAWMFVAGSDVSWSDAMVMTAPDLQGPWTTRTDVASTCPTGSCGVRYAITPHPEYDPTGKTLLITWTDANVIHASRITWR